MTTVKSSRQFVYNEKLPQFESSTPFREVYARLSDLNLSGFMLIEKGMPRCYVTGYGLAKSWMERFANQPTMLGDAFNKPIGNVITQDPLSTLEVASEPVWEGTNVEDLPRPLEQVFAVRSSGLQIGWFLGKSTVLDASTGKTVWVCKKGHRNPDPDNGTCYVCPFPIDHPEMEP